jgi:hypothetical protein
MVLPVTRSNKETNLLLSAEGVDLSVLEDAVSRLRQDLDSIITNPATVVVPSSVNQLRNGSYSASWASWYDTGLTNNTNLECFPWFSQPVVASQPMQGGNAYDGNITFTYSFANVNTGTDIIDLVTPPHWMITGTPIRFTTAGTLPSPIVINTTYFVIAVSTTTIRVATSLANAIAGIYIDLTTQGTGNSTLNWSYALKESLNTTYSSLFSDWDWVTGTARLNGDTDVSTYFSPTTLDPSYSYFAGITCVKANQYITCDSEVRVATGLYAESTAKAGWDWVYGAFEATAEVVGTVSTPTSRDYVIHAITDRGFTVQSTPLTVANAPSNADFNAPNSARVVLEWPQVLNYGILSYDIYRKTGATYEKLISIVTGQLSYIDNNVVSATVGGYPAADFEELVAFTATQEGTIQGLSYSGDPLVNQWGTIPFAIRVPYNYDKGDTVLTSKYWLRFYLTGQNANGRLDLQMTDGAIEGGNTTLTSAAGQFSNTDPNMVGLDIDITDSSGNVLSTTIASYTSATEIETTDPWAYADATDATIYIYGGAPSHSLLMDLTFLDFRAGTGFAPNNEDISPDRGIPPVTPNGSTQGGSGSGGGGSDGGVRCISFDENVLTDKGIVIGRDLKNGMMLPNGYGGVNQIHEVKYGLADIWLFETANGVSLQCTLTKQIFTSKQKKKLASKLNVGDSIVTCIDGVIADSPIKFKRKIKTRVPVVQIGLKPDEHFLAGQNGFVVVSNNKPADI